jgi:putative spermidine/putrescine transport system permease protein
VDLSRPARAGLGLFTFLGFVFLYTPLVIVLVLSFNTSRTFTWPPEGFTLDWWEAAAHNQGARDALWTSIRVAFGATAVALVLGTLASFAVARFSFFGRETISFLVILPIALPGIVTGIALNRAFSSIGFSLGYLTVVIAHATFTQTLNINLGLFTIVTAHATFCIVVVYNNVIARLRRVSTSFEEASADLGADTWQTFRHVTFPNLRTALVAGGLLAFALSFDEIIVTTFTAGPDQTLPIWIFTNLSRPNQLPIVNVVATTMLLLSAIPVYFAHKLTQDEAVVGSAGAGAAVEGAAV